MSVVILDDTFDRLIKYSNLGLQISKAPREFNFKTLTIIINLLFPKHSSPTGGEKSIVHYYETSSVRELYQLSAFTSPLVRIVRSNGKRVYAIVTADHNIALYRLHSPESDLETRPGKILKLRKQFVGFSDEILDIVLLGMSAVFFSSDYLKVHRLYSFRKPKMQVKHS